MKGDNYYDKILNHNLKKNDIDFNKTKILKQNFLDGNNQIK